MNSQREAYYRLAPGVDIVLLSEGDVLFRSDNLAIRIEGGFSRVLAERVASLLDGQHSLTEIAAKLPDLTIDDLRHKLDALVQAQVLRCADHPNGPQSADEQAVAPFLIMLDALGIDSAEALQRLSGLRVAIAGLEGHGAHVASILVSCGIGSIILLDPYPCQLGNLTLMPLVGMEAVGKPRQQTLKAVLQAQGGKTEILTGGDGEITRERISILASNCHMLVSCFDKGFSSTHHWINRASLEHGVPAIYAESRGHTVLVGPLVLPGQTACYMCYRMRSVACQENFNAAMSYEEFLDRRKRPALHERGVLPTVPPYIASLLALEILKHLLSLSPPSLAGKVLEFDALSLRTDTHTILQKPDCPVCRVKKKWDRYHPSLLELRQSDNPPGDPVGVVPQLLSRRTGIIRDFQLMQKDASEPTRPYVFRTELANHRFLEDDSRNRISSGKGMTIEDAQTSALGEAVERYSGACWEYDEIVSARRSDIEGKTLDPRRLVLYAPSQYEQLPYAPYKDESVMGWVRARSLVTGEHIFVPALAVYMGYEAKSPEEFIFPVTSNGLAAGRTLLDAILRATFEVLERDALMITWLNQLPCQYIDPWTHPDSDIVQLCEAYRRRKVEMYLYRLPTDHPCHVFTALGLQDERNSDGPTVVVGLGADMAPSRAAQRAILEVGQVRPALRRRMRRPETRMRMEELAANPHLVTELEDHDLLYASRKRLNAFDFLLNRPLESFEWEPPSLWSSIDRMQSLVGHFRSKGWDLIYYNLTPPDMLALGLHTARVMLPGFQPIDFGWKERRLGGDRLYDLPHRLGITSSRTSLEQLNSNPHPLS